MDTQNIPSNHPESGVPSQASPKPQVVQPEAHFAWKKIAGISLGIFVLILGAFAFRGLQTRNNELTGDVKLALSPQQIQVQPTLQIQQGELVLDEGFQLNAQQVEPNQDLEVQQQLNPDPQAELQIQEPVQEPVPQLEVQQQLNPDPEAQLEIKQQELVLDEPLQIVPQQDGIPQKELELAPQVIEPIVLLDVNQGQPIPIEQLNIQMPQVPPQLPVSMAKVAAWFRGENLIAQNGKVFGWVDVSGNENHLTGFDVTRRPNFVQSDAFNGQPAAQFDGVDDLLQSVLPKGGYSRDVFIVLRPTEANGFSAQSKAGTVLGFDDPDLDNNVEKSGLNVGPTAKSAENSVFTWMENNFPASAMKSNGQALQRPLVIRHTIAAQGNIITRINGVNVESSDIDFEGSIPSFEDLPFFLGTNAGKNNYFKGEVAELILAKENMTAAEGGKIEDYLSVKYGISPGDAYMVNGVGQPANQDIDMGTGVLASFPTKFAQRIAGVVRNDSLGLDLDASKSTQPQGVVTVYAPNLSSGEYVMWGSTTNAGQIVLEGDPNLDEDDGAQGWYNNIGFGNLLGRKWKIEENVNGSFVMGMTLSNQVDKPEISGLNLLIPEPADNEQYAFAFFTTDDFSLDPVFSIPVNDDGQNGDQSANDKIYSATINNLQGAKYFTLAKDIQDSQGPEDLLQPQPQEGTFELHVRAQDQNGTVLGGNDFQFSYNQLPWVGFPHIFTDQNLADLNGPTELLFASLNNTYAAPEKLTIQNKQIQNVPGNVNVYLNNMQTPYQGGAFKDGDTIIVIAKFFKLDAPNNPPSILELNDVNQATDGTGKVLLNLGMADQDKNNLKLRTEFENDHDGQCNGPWQAASVITPVVGGALLSAQQQQQNQNFQIGNIATPNGQAVVKLTWDSKEDAPDASFGTSECLRFTPRDDLSEGLMKTFAITIDNTSPAPVVITSPENFDETYEETLITGTCEPNAGVFLSNFYFTQDPAFTVCKDDGTFAKTVFWSVNTPESVQEIFPTQVDQYGNMSGGDHLQLTYKYPEGVIAPVVIVTPQENDEVYGQTQFDGTCEPGMTVYIDNGHFVQNPISTVCTDEGTFSALADWSPNTPEGMEEVFAHQENEEGETQGAGHTIFLNYQFPDNNESASITVSVEGPESLDEVLVDIPGVVEDASINNGEEEIFKATPNTEYQVICPEIEGYVLITDPHPIVINALEPGENQDAICQYANQEQEENEPEPVIPVCGNSQIEQGEQCDDGNQITEACAYGLANCNVCNASCQNVAGAVTGYCGDKVLNFNNGEQCDDGNLVNGDGCSSICKGEPQQPVQQPNIVINPPAVNVNNVTNVYNPAPVDSGQSKTGAVYYSAPEEEDEYNYNQRCLEYDANRPLKFVDIKTSDKGAKEANILKNTFLAASEVYRQYVLSGLNTTANSQGEANVGITLPITRTAWMKMLLITHCYPIYDAESLPNTTYSGKPLKSYFDLPKEKASDFTDDIIYSASFEEIMHGTDEGNAEKDRFITLAEAIKTLITAGEFGQGYQYQRDDAALQGLVSKDQWYFPFFSKAARAGLLDNFPKAHLRANEAMIRNEGFIGLLEAILQRGLYNENAEAQVKKLL